MIVKVSRTSDIPVPPHAVKTEVMMHHRKHPYQTISETDIEFNFCA